MANSMPDLTDDFDFGTFLNLPPDDVDQGVVDGLRNGFSDALNLNGKGLDVPRPSHDPALLGPSNNAEARQSTNFQLQTNNGSPRFEYAASNLYGDEIVPSGHVRAASAAVSKTTSLETIARGNCEEISIAPCYQEWSPPFTPDPATHEVSVNHCACISCLEIKRYILIPKDVYRYYKCHFPGCLQSERREDLYHHEIGHYIRDGKFTCLEPKCQVSTGDFADLRRHYKKHCTSPNKEQFPCPVSWCKFSGNNGFLRKDKLKSHYRNIHEGKPGPAKAGRVIKPATLKPRVSGVENGSSKQNQ